VKAARRYPPGLFARKFSMACESQDAIVISRFRCAPVASGLSRRHRGPDSFHVNLAAYKLRN
jgi:hypothetical protein